jgi:putative CocE/NonD family hydrolase
MATAQSFQTKVLWGLGRLFIAAVASGELMSANAAVLTQPGALEPAAAQFEVEVTKDLWIPMRDGVRLAADLYRPKGVQGRLPVILIRTPYSKDRWPPPDGEFFAGHGFAVIVEDFRGRYKSEGVYHFNRGHRQDGYDTFAWIVAQPWSAGKIGTYGCSYLGEVQLYQAPARPPGLTAMIPQAAGSAIGSAGGYFHNAEDLGGGVWGLDILFDWWYREGEQLFYAPRQATPADPARAAEVAKLYRVGPDPPVIDYGPVLSTLPIVDMMKQVVTPPNEWADFVRHNVDLTDPWWRQFDYVTDDTQIDVPTLFIESWNDFTAAATLYLRNHLEQTAPSEVARRNQYIIVAPGSHCSSERMTAHESIGDQFVGDPRFGHRDIYLKWFNYWLRGEPTGITQMPKIQYYVLGKNKWRATNAWPVPGTRFQSYYLSSGGHANSHFGDGVLVTAPPTAAQPDAYIYDPETPAPSLGTNDYKGSKPITDQRPLSAREDVLVYTSAPLTRGFEMTGEIEVALYVSSSTRDTDFMAKVVDIYPDGTALNVRENVLRARYRNGRNQPAVLMSPGEVYPLHFKLGAYSLYFPQGHRLRLQITSSSFPRYERNLNTGGNNFDETRGVIAQNHIYHDRDHPSRVILPVAPE